MGFMDSFKEQMKADIAKQKEKNEVNKDKADEIENMKKEMDKQGTVYCPKCLSTSINANKKGFGVGKALIGGALTGGVGLLAGTIGSKKIELTCLKCGHKFKAGK